MWGQLYPHVVLLIFANTIVKVSCKGNGSLTFLIDDTSSMGDDIDQVRKSVDKITRLINNENSSLIDNIVLVTFNDPGVYDRVVTRDPEEFKKALALIKPHNEANPLELDCWEPSMKGLLQALNKSKNHSYIFVFTDAPAKDYIDSHYVIEMCQKKQTQIVFVLTGKFCHRFPYVPEARNVYFDIAVACSGLAIFVKKNEVEKVFGPIEEIIKGNKNVITTATVPAGVSKNIMFPIDDYTDYVIVSASGNDVTLDINDTSVEEIMSTSNAKVVKLRNTKSGNYVVTVKGKTNTSVVIVGRTDFFFSHGFSELKPKLLSDTSPQPNSDAKSYLAVSVTDDNHSIRIVAAKILDMDGKPIIEKLPLTEISDDFYITAPFVAPSQRFKVAVEGIVKATNKPINRTAKIPVTPPPPKIAPKVQGVTAMKVTKGKTAVFECKVVNGFPAPKITWLFWSKSDLKFTLLAGSESVLRITNVQEQHGGKYKCEAENGAGKDEHVTTLFVLDHPKIESSGSHIFESTEGDALLRIPCVAAGLPKPSITWMLNGYVINPSTRYSIEDGTLIIRDLKVNDTNSYTCEAKNEVGAVSTTFRTNINQTPLVSGVTDKKVRIGTPATIECTVVKGKPEPTITWEFLDNSGSDLPILGSDKVLHISRVESKHAGRYKCVAKNKVGSNEHITTLDVQDFPKIVSSGSNNYESTEGDALLRIPCVAAGLPKPNITWKLNGLVINPSAKYSIEHGTLIISNLKVSDTNLFTCEAKNEVGAVSATFRTNINQAPQVSGVTDKKVRIGMPATIECTVVKGKPEPTITWEFMDNSGSDLPILGSDNVLHISRVENKHAGRYKCVAKNKVGSNEHITTLDVQDLPKIVSIVSNTYESTEGDALLRIPCVATGLPKPSITWKLNGIVIVPSTRYSIENGTLIIRDLKVNDTNSYTCEAKNEVGAVSVTFRTNINQAPQVSGFTNKKVRIGTSATIECTVVKGKPKPTITWEFMDNSGSDLPILGSDEVLHISRVENKHAGRYKCVVKNKVGSDEHVTTLIVESLPEITTKSTTVEGIEGDLALGIPCDVVGIPQPVVTWKINGTKITTDAKYSIEHGALVIVKPSKNDSSSYTCEAKNSVGSVTTTFQAAVKKQPATFGKKHHVYLILGETRKLKCEAYSSDSQSVMWFETKAKPRSLDPDSSLSTTTSPPDLESSETTTPSSKDYYSSTTMPTITLNASIKEPYMQIRNASYFDDGIYTCRVSDKHGNTHTHTFVVDVGSAPQFISDADSLSDWRGDISYIKQKCDIQANLKPQPVVEWTYNGEVLTDFNSANVGHYTCNVSNALGSVQKRFDVKSSVCLITRNMRDAQYMPLVLNDTGFWHKFESTKHYLVVKQEEKITLSCPRQKETSNTFKKFPKKNTLEAFCYNEDSFLVEGKKYKLSDLQCANSIQPSVIRKKVKCSTETSELIRVGYNVSGFLEAYEVCFDTEKNMPLYTRIIMTETNNNGWNAGYNGGNWYTYPGIGNKETERGFTCKNTMSSSCYSKSQLVNAKDFNDGPAKKSTFIDPLNAIPVWLPRDTSRPTWETINDNVTSMLPIYNEIVTWSGTHTFQEINGAIIPRYLWKVVWYNDKEVLAIVHVNHPSPTEKDIKCKDICTTYSDWIEFNDKYTYCCSLSDFIEAFNIHNIDIGESLDAALDEIKKKTD